MKTCIFILICICLASCKKDKPVYKSEGVITGYDRRTCAMCGGLMINFNNDTALYSPGFYLISNDPKQLGITEQTHFPLSISADWQPDTLKKGSNSIVITSFKIN